MVYRISASDTFNEGYELDTKFFRLTFDTNLLGNSGRKDLKIIKTKYFKCKSYPAKEGDCLLAIIRNGKQIQTIRRDLKLDGGIKIEDIPSLEKYLKININIFNDEILIDKKIKDTDSSNKTIVSYEYEKFFESNNIYKGITYDILLKDQHYSLIYSKKELFFDQICGDMLKMTKKGPKMLTDLQIRKSLVRQGRKIAGDKNDDDNLKEKFLFFDIETIFNPYKLYMLEPYSVSWHISDKAIKFSSENIEKKIDECQLLIGENCLDKFVNWIENNSDGVKYVLIGYNNSRFDNFPLLRSLINADIFTSLMFVQNSILQLRFGQKNRCFDLCRFVMTSLDNACKSFNISPKKLQGFSHYEPQNAFMRGGWNVLQTWIVDHYEKLERYNKIDVLATENLFFTVRIAYCKLLGLDILDYTTLASASYDKFKNTNEYNINAPPTRELDIFIRKAIIGGRCQKFVKNHNINELLSCVDVKSLYPYVMLNRHYPINKIIQTDKYINDKLGIYNVKIIKQPSKNIIPFRNTDGSLDWEYEGKIKTELTSIEIECILRHGGEVKIYDGIYWNNSTDKLFEKYFEKIKEEKTKQDLLNKQQDVNYNPALRNIAKLLLNSLSGKFVQRNFEESHELVKNIKEEAKFFEKTKSQELKLMIGDYRLFRGELKDDKIYSVKKAKPSYIGVFIYAHARTYMYDILYSNYNVLYTDTDSGLLCKKDWDDFKNKYIECVGEGPLKYYKLTDKQTNIPTIGNEFGQFEEELNTKGKSCISYIIAKKIYCIQIKDKNGVIQKESKYRIKGINIRRDRWLSQDIVDEINQMKDNDKKKEYLYNLKKELDKKYDETKDIKNNECNTYEQLEILNHFKELEETGKTNFLCGQIKKHEKLYMTQSFSIKTLTKEEIVENDIDII